jgi:hypothetical protein
MESAEPITQSVSPREFQLRWFDLHSSRPTVPFTADVVVRHPHADGGVRGDARERLALLVPGSTPMLVRPAEGATMPGKTPQRPSTKKVGKSLKEKRAAKKQKRDEKRIIPGG